MTVWDEIYTNYEKGGFAWASLSENIHPMFIDFLKKSEFSRKYVLDLGCGDGKYLLLLRKADSGQTVSTPARLL